MVISLAGAGSSSRSPTDVSGATGVSLTTRPPASAWNPLNDGVTPAIPGTLACGRASDSARTGAAVRTRSTTSRAPVASGCATTCTPGSVSPGPAVATDPGRLSVGVAVGPVEGVVVAGAACSGRGSGDR